MFKNWRRRRLLTHRSIPEPAWSDMVNRVPVLRRLGARRLERLGELSLAFLHEKSIEPAGGLQLDDSMRIRIAALACLPILELGLDWYEGFASVIVYPDEFVVPDREEVDEVGVVHVGDDLLSGESWEHGPVILAWQDVEASGLGHAFNVVAHEFAHKLDLLNGAVNGLPPLHRDMRLADWTDAFQHAYDDLVRCLDRGEESWLDPYAGESPAEFFAVCVEMFFDVPEEFVGEHPALYAQLAAFFKQDPARSGRNGKAAV